MPITVRQTPVGTLGQLAVMAGQVRGQQLRMGRDIQLLSITRAAQSRAWAIDEAARDRAFALQRAGAAQIAEQRPVTPDTQAQRQKLQQFVSEAKATGIYDLKQIKQMEIFAKVGDEQAVRSIAGRLPTPTPVEKPTARQKELNRQSRAFGGITQETLAPLQKELTEVNRQISARYESKEIQEFVEKKPERLPPNIREKFLKMFSRRRELEAQISQVRGQAEQIQQSLSLGFTIPEQTLRKAQRISKEQQTKIAAVKRIEGRNQRRIEQQLAIEEQRLKVDPYADPAKEKIRVDKVSERITKLKTDLKASYAREDAVLGRAGIPKQMTPNEENALMDAYLAETKGDVQAAMRLMAEREGR